MQRRSRDNNVKVPAPRSRSRTIIGLTVSACILVILHSIIIPNISVVFKKPPSDELMSQVRSSVQEVMRQYGIRDEWKKIRGEKLEIQIPINLRYYQMFGDIVEEIQHYNGEVCSSSADLRKRTRTLEIGVNGIPAVKLLFKQRDDLSLSIARVAVIIDDFGYAFNGVAEGFISVPHEITLSIIPGQKYSERVAREAYHKGKEVMLHLPMEPLEDSVQDLGYTIYAGQPEIEVRERVNKAIKSVPFVKGLNNHKGSKATADVRVMKFLLQELKEHNLYFIDSRTSSNSVGFQTARQMGLLSQERSIFIDSDEDEPSIRENLNRLCAIAMKNGEAVGIGHAKQKTLIVLNEYLEEFEGKGVDFVTVSEIVH
jgi:polysaccharide deacetylase 2 family uncharacterized protein YibQ